MNKNIKKVGIILVIVVAVSLLIFAQYKYSSKTKIAENLEYVDTFDVGSHYEVSIFKHNGEYISFSIVEGKARWLTRGSIYRVEYKDAMWHRSELLIINTEEQK